MLPKFKTVLVIEDDPTIAMTLKGFLERDDLVVFVAKDGQEGMRKLSAIQRPCLVLCDLMMPNMDGWEVVKLLKEADELVTLPVVVMSAAATPGEALRDVPFIKKPFDLGALEEIVTRHCGERCELKKSA